MSLSVGAPADMPKMSATPPVFAPDGSDTGAGAAAGAAGAAAEGSALSPGFGSSAAIAGRIVPAARNSAARHSIRIVHFRRCRFMSILLDSSGPIARRNVDGLLAPDSPITGS